MIGTIHAPHRLASVHEPVPVLEIGAVLGEEVGPGVPVLARGAGTPVVDERALELVATVLAHRVLLRAEMIAQVADQIHEDEAVRKPPRAAVANEAIVVAPGDDRLQRHGASLLQHREVRARERRPRGGVDSITRFVVTCFVRGAPSSWSLTTSSAPPRPPGAFVAAAALGAVDRAGEERTDAVQVARVDALA